METISNKQKIVKRVSILGISCNLFLVIIKLIAGVLSSSQSMMADALHSIEDMMSSVVSYVAIKISSKPNDKDHPYGHGEVEYTFSFLISIIMMIMSITMIKSTVMNILSGTKIVFSSWIIIVCVITLLIKLALYMYSNKKYKQTGNILVRAGRDDHRNDLFVTGTVLISTICSAFGLYFIDYIFGIVISIFIAIVGIKIFRLSYKVLIDTNLCDEKIEDIISSINEYDEVKKVNRIIGKPVGEKYVVILKISMNRNLDVYDSHDIESAIKRKLIKENEYIQDVVIHVNPY
ncbi:MAG: cation diffusion facilitator family transporter [Clostridia bacterium]|nr:cation diffusion facilitator family transporter [Clostridia bacterium]